MDSEGRVLLHPHALARATERGATIDEIGSTIATGERLEAKHGVESAGGGKSWK